MNNQTPTPLPQFGDYITVEVKRYGVPNEHYKHKVIGTIKSNSFTDVPVQAGANKPYIHTGGLVDVVLCICCGISEEEVVRYRADAVEVIKPSAPPAEQTAEEKSDVFTWFTSHGDEEGRSYTITYGDYEESEDIIVGAAFDQEEAEESVRRLNDILRSHSEVYHRQLEAAAKELPDNSSIDYFSTEHLRMGDDNDAGSIASCKKMGAIWLREQAAPIIAAKDSQLAFLSKHVENIADELAAREETISELHSRVRELEEANKKVTDERDTIRLFENQYKDLIASQQSRIGELEARGTTSGQMYVYNGIDNSMEDVSSFAEAQDVVKETIIEGNELHPDAESVYIVQTIAIVKVEETGEYTKINGEDAPVCKVNIVPLTPPTEEQHERP